MKKLIIFLVVGIFLLTGSPVFAAKGGGKGPSDRAYERANENARFKRDENWQPGADSEKKEGKKQKKDKKAKKNKKDKKNKKNKEDKKKDEQESSEEATTPVIQNEAVE
jgi:hypothetical protein